MNRPRKGDTEQAGPATPGEDHAAPAATKLRRRQMLDALMLYAVVAVGAMIGGVLRALTGLAGEALGGGFPFATLLVNAVGSFAIGFFATLTAPEGRAFASPRQRQFFMTGFCGGLTTFSTFSLETAVLARNGLLLEAGINLAVSVVTWLAAVWLGHMLAARLNRLKGS